jgi:hypothetical protein
VYCLCVLYYCHRVATQMQLNISCHIITIISYRIVSYRIISYHTISYNIISYYITSHHIIISYHILYHIIPYHIISSYHIISYHIISYHIISSYHIIYHIISYHIIYHVITAWKTVPFGLRGDDLTFRILKLTLPQKHSNDCEVWAWSWEHTDGMYHVAQ